MKYLVNDNTNLKLHGLIIEIPEDFEGEFFQVDETFLRVSHLIKNPTVEDVSKQVRELIYSINELD